MFETVSKTQQAGLWLSVIMFTGFVSFTALGIAPLVKIVREQFDTIYKLREDLRVLLEKERKGKE